MALLISADDVIDLYLSGESLLLDAENNRVVSDEMIEQQIANQTAIAAAVLGVPLEARRYAARPDVAIQGQDPLDPDDYDVVTDCCPWVARKSTLDFGGITLRHRPIISIQRVRALVGDTVLYTVPPSWITFNRQNGTVEVVPASPSNAFAEILVANGIINTWVYGRERIPNFWAIDYTAGFTAESALDTFPAILDWIVWNALAKVLGLATIKLNPQGVTNQSVSKDGVSRSFSSDESKPGGRFARLLSQKGVDGLIGLQALQDLAPHLVNQFRVF